MLQLSSARSLTRECPKPKNVVFINTSFSAVFVSSIVILTEFYPMSVVDFGATK